MRAQNNLTLQMKIQKMIGIYVYETFDQLFEKSLKLKKVNNFAFKKLNVLKLENENLVVKLEE